MVNVGLTISGDDMSKPGVTLIVLGLFAAPTHATTIVLPPESADSPTAGSAAAWEVPAWERAAEVETTTAQADGFFPDLRPDDASALAITSATDFVDPQEIGFARTWPDAANGRAVSELARRRNPEATLGQLSRSFSNLLGEPMQSRSYRGDLVRSIRR